MGQAIWTVACLSRVDGRKAVSLRLCVFPPGRRSAAAAPAARQPTLPRPPTLKAVKLAFLPASPHASRMRLRLSHASLASVPWAPSPPRGLPLLLPRAGETVAARAVHRLARATLHWPARGARLPDRLHAPALLREKRSR